MSDVAWVVSLLGVLTLWAMVASVMWLRERNERCEWQMVATTLGDEYDKLFTEHCSRTVVVLEKPKQTWLN